MNGFEQLLQYSGQWAGQYRLQPYVSDAVSESASALTVTPVLADTFVRLDQGWSWRDQPQFGSLLVGYLPQKDVVTIHWIDTWHNGRGCMNLTGRIEPPDRL